MFRKVMLTLLCGLAGTGVVLTIVGFALGGRPGHINVENGYFHFSNGSLSQNLGPAPSYWNDMDAYFFSGPFISSPSDSPPDRIWEDGVPLEADRETVRVEITVGTLIIRGGDESRLEVTGDLEYETSYDANAWTLRSEHSQKDLFLGGGHLIENYGATFVLTLAPTVKKLEVDMDAGQVEISELVLEKLDVDMDAGQVELWACRAVDLAVETNAGDVNMNDMDAFDARFSVDLGRISYSGNLVHTLKADCNVGTIEINTPQPQHYGWETQVGVGMITIGGENYGGLLQGKSSGNEDATPFYDLKCDAGTIDVSFY